MTEPREIMLDLGAFQPPEIQVEGDLTDREVDLIVQSTTGAWRAGLTQAAQATWNSAWKDGYLAGYRVGWSTRRSASGDAIPAHDHHDPASGGPVALPVIQLAPTTTVKQVVRDDAGDISRVIEVSAPTSEG